MVEAVSFVEALTTAILPVLSIAGVGYVLASFREIDVDPLATVTIYVLTPALVFHSLLTTPITGDVAATLVVGVAVFLVAMAILGEVAGRGLGEREPVLGAFVLASSFPNAGNYGIPLAAFAFGDIGRSTAVLYIAAQALVMYTVGVFVASRGSASSVGDAAVTVFRLPLVYAVVGGIAVRWLGVVPGEETAAMQTLQLTGDSAIPVMLLLLGVQLANASTGTTIGRVAPSVLIKLGVAPAIALVVALLVGLEGTVGRVFILACSMPAAITPLMLTIEFGRDHDGLSAAEYVSTAIFVGTVASVVTLALLITLLQSGALV